MRARGEVIRLRVEVRGGCVLLDGYVNAVGRDSRPIPDRRGAFVEQVAPGAFARALGRGLPVGLKLNHERALGSTATGEVALFEDSIGLRAKAKVTDAAVIKKARDKELRGWSFGFRSPTDEWEEREGAPPRRYLNDFELTEVSLIDASRQPAYPATSVEVRGDVETVTEFRASDDAPEYVEAGGTGGEEPPSGSDAGDAGAKVAYAGYVARRLRLA
jgi:HK97 family phage prohead protease